MHFFSAPLARTEPNETRKKTTKQSTDAQHISVEKGIKLDFGWYFH